MFSLAEYFIQNDQRNIYVLVLVIDKTEVIVLGPKKSASRPLSLEPAPRLDFRDRHFSTFKAQSAGGFP